MESLADMTGIASALAAIADARSAVGLIVGLVAGLFVAFAGGRIRRRDRHRRIRVAATALDSVLADVAAILPKTAPNEPVAAGSFDTTIAAVEQQVRTVTELVYRDSATGLLNSLGLQRQLGATRCGDGQGLFVAVLAIDRFDRIRTRIGHELSVAVLRELGARLNGEFHVARLDTDVIGVGLAAYSEAEAVVQLERAGAIGSRKVEIGGCSIDLVVTGGLAGPIGPGDSAALSIDRARHALEHARSSNQRLATFGNAGHDSVADRLSLMRDLRLGLGRGEMFLCYQPKFRARTHELAGVEALLRWHHPRRGAITPAEFIPLAEETGDIGAMTEWVIARAVEDQRMLAAAGFDLRVHVNVSASLIGDPSFGASAVRAMGEHTHVLGIEITETAVIEDPEAALANLELLADAGVRIAIDDYGSGMSSLAYLKRLPAHELKIDKLFVSGLTQSHRDPLLVRSTIDLAHGLGMEVTAEGVETPSALALLRVMGCDLVQGYLLACPMPLADLIAFLADDQRLAHLPAESHNVLKPASYWERAAAPR